VVAKLLVDGGELLAVTAPGGVELDEDVFASVLDDIVVVLADDDHDVALVLGDGLGLDVRLGLAGDDTLDVGADALGGDLAREGVLVVLLGVVDGESGPLADLQVDIVGVTSVLGGVNVDKVNLALVVLGHSLNEGAHGGAVLGGDEEVGEGETAVHKLLVVLGANLVHGGDGVGLDEGGDLALGEAILGLKDVLLLVELLEENDGGGGDRVGGKGAGIEGDTEHGVVAESLGNLGEGLVVAVLLAVEKSNNHNPLRVGEGIKVLSGEGGNSGEHLPKEKKKKKGQTSPEIRVTQAAKNKNKNTRPRTRYRSWEMERTREALEADGGKG